MRGVRELAVGTGRRAHEWSRKCAHDVRPVLELGSGPLGFFLTSRMLPISSVLPFPVHFERHPLDTSTTISVPHVSPSFFGACIILFFIRLSSTTAGAWLQPTKSQTRSPWPATFEFDP